MILNDYFPNFETNSQGGQNKLEHCFYFMTKWNLFELRRTEAANLIFNFEGNMR